MYAGFLIFVFVGLSLGIFAFFMIRGALIAFFGFWGNLNEFYYKDNFYGDLKRVFIYPKKLFVRKYNVLLGKDNNGLYIFSESIFKSFYPNLYIPWDKISVSENEDSLSEVEIESPSEVFM